MDWNDRTFPTKHKYFKLSYYLYSFFVFSSNMLMKVISVVLCRKCTNTNLCYNLQGMGFLSSAGIAFNSSQAKVNIVFILLSYIVT